MCSDGAGLVSGLPQVCVLSDRSFLCFRLSLKIEPGDGSPRLASHKKELAGTQRRASVKVPQYLLEPLGVFWFML